jgi:Na+/H+-translocating membrane pyrophosphatase
VSTILIILSFYLWSWTAAPARMYGFVLMERGRIYAFWCLTMGLLCGVAIGFVTEYYTSHAYGPVREVAHSCETGAATNIIYGLALGH